MNECLHHLAAKISSLFLISIMLGPTHTHGGSDLPNLAKIKAAAEVGDAQAQDSLAEAYRQRYDNTNKIFWYRKAAAQGVPNSQYQLGEILVYEATSSLARFDATAKKQKASEGVEFLRRAAHQDHKRAQLHLGRLCEEGRLLPQDYVEAYKSFAIAGQGGPLDPPSMEGRMYRDRLILKMSQAQITEGEARAKSFTPGPMTAAQSAQPAYVTSLKLQGISGTAQRRLAIINGQTFAAGESARVKVGGRSVTVECLELSANTARVRLDKTGVPIELQLNE